MLANPRNNMSSQVRKPFKIALIDDCQSVRRSFRMQMANLGWSVMTLENSFGVAVKLIEFAPDVIFLDVEMPGLTGEGLSRVLRNKRCLPNALVFYYSSVGTDELKKLTHDSQIEGFYCKSENYISIDQSLRLKLKAPPRNSKAG